MAKYCKEIVDEICAYLAQGMTQQEVCDLVGINTDTFHNWKNTKAEFSEAIKVARRDFLRIQAKDVIRSLYKRATGYDVEEPEIIYGDRDGKPYIKQKKVRTKHIPADPTAQKFILTNLYPDEWKDKQQNELTGTLANKVTIEYVDSGIELAHSEDEITDL